MPFFRIIIWAITFIVGPSALAEGFSYKDSKRVTSDDYFFKDNGEKRDRSFRNYQILSADVDLGISTGSCGEINLHKTLQGSLKSVINEEAFQQIGKDLASSSFMLLTCYWSPQICSILKNSRLTASMLSKVRMSQCQAITKYVDSRVSDWEMSRQRCYNQELRSNGGDAGAAMDKCGQRSYNYDMASWSGGKSGSDVKVNKLIQSSAEWMGFKGTEAQRVVDVTKAFVGDSVLAQGSISVDFGPRGKGVSPRMYYLEQKGEVEKRIKEIFEKIDRRGGASQVSNVATDEELKKISGGDKILVSRSAIGSLYKMPHSKRESAYEKLSGAVALHKLATDANKSLDLLMIASQNPNLPPNRKKELDEKRRALKETLEATIYLEKQKNEPLNEVLARIKDEGHRYHSRAVKRNLDSEAGQYNSNQIRKKFFDCADGFMCM